MPSVKVTVNIEVDGEPLKGMPYVRRFETAAKDGFDTNQPTNAAFVALPSTGVVSDTQFLFLQPLTATLGVKVKGDGTAFNLSKGGFLLLIDSASVSGTTIQQNSGSAARVVCLRAGTAT